MHELSLAALLLSRIEHAVALTLVFFWFVRFGRFLPSFGAVESMRAGATPQEACAEALCRIAR